MGLRVCETCNCRGFIGHQGIGGACPTCEGSGFSNATSEQAREAEIAAHRGEVYELPSEEERLAPYVLHLHAQVDDLTGVTA